MNVAMSVGLAFAAILGAYLFMLWFASAGVIEQHEDRLTVMEKRWDETFGGPEPAVEDAKAPPGPGDSAKNSPVALGGADAEPSAYDPDASTDEIPVAPATVPDGMPLVVQSALIEQRPSPVPREAEMVERTVNIGGTLQTFRIPAREDT